MSVSFVLLLLFMFLDLFVLFPLQLLSLLVPLELPVLYGLYK